MKNFGTGDRLISDEIAGIAKLLSVVSVDVDSGSCVWSVDRNNRTKAGMPAGTQTKKGYTRLQFEGKGYMLHRIVFYIANGYLPQLIDHVKGVEAGNGIANLQEITNRQNVQKKKRPSHNQSGSKGVHWHSGVNRWRAQITINGKKTHIGYYDSLDDAKKAYQIQSIKHFGEFHNESP